MNLSQVQSSPKLAVSLESRCPVPTGCSRAKSAQCYISYCSECCLNYSTFLAFLDLSISYYSGRTWSFNVLSHSCWCWDVFTWFLFQSMAGYLIRSDVLVRLLDIHCLIGVQTSKTSPTFLYFITPISSTIISISILELNCLFSSSCTHSWHLQICMNTLSTWIIIDIGRKFSFLTLNWPMHSPFQEITQMDFHTSSLWATSRLRPLEDLSRISSPDAVAFIKLLVICRQILKGQVSLEHRCTEDPMFHWQHWTWS